MFSSLIKSVKFSSSSRRSLISTKTFSLTSYKSQSFANSKLFSKTKKTSYFQMFTGASLGFIALSQLYSTNPVQSEVAMRQNFEKIKEAADDTSEKLNRYTVEGVDAVTGKSKTKSERHAIYRKITTGSLLGLFSGIIVGKVSQILVIVTSTIFVFLELLASRGLFKKPEPEISSHFYNNAKNSGSKILNKLSKSVDYIGENPAMRLSFLISFLMSATA
ncbi:hypothetical protein QEN19_000583 [Hanseniaspora menglaensis]